MVDKWNKRYAAEEYSFGTAPNAFFKEQLDLSDSGRLLLPAEGEGRNAIYAAENNWEVVAFDSSEQGRKKALKLANEKDVNIDYQVNDFKGVDFKEGEFDAIALIFAHMPEGSRREYHQKMLKYLKPGGIIILEGFEKNQIDLNTGGPKDKSWLFASHDLFSDFSSLSNINVAESKVELNEGASHQGEAAIIRLIGKK